MDDLAKLGIKVDASDAATASALLDKLGKSAEGTASSTELLETGFKKLMIVLGPAVIAGALVRIAAHAYELQASFVRLSEVAGTLPSQMAALDLPARLAGTSLEGVTMAVARLSRVIGEAQTAGGAQQRGILKAMGIDPDQAMDPVDRFVQVSRAIMGMTDANVQAYAAQHLLNRSFAEMRPVMKEIIEQGGLHKRTTDEQLRASKQFEDQIIKLNFEMEQGKIAIANNYLPYLQDLVKAFSDGYKEGGLLEAAIRGVQTALTGSDLHKANVELFALTERMVGIQNKIQEIKFETSKGVPEFEINGMKSSIYWQKQLDEIMDKLNRVRAFRAQLEGEQSGDKPGGKGGAGSDKDPEAAKREAALRAQMENSRLLERRVAEQKGYGERYADAIATANILAQEAHKSGLLQDDDYIKQVSANNKALLQAQKIYLEQTKKDYAAVPGREKEVQETENAIKKANAAIIANDAITTAKLNASAYDKVMNYRQWQTAAAQAGEAVVDSITLAEQLENKSYEKRKADLEVFLADNRDQDLDDKSMREAFEMQHQQRLLAIKRSAAETERGMIVQTLQMASDFMNLFAAKSKAAALISLAIQKGLAAAQVVVNTQAAIARGYAELGVYGGTANAVRMEALMAIQLGIIAATALVEGGRVASGSGGSAATPTFSASPVTGSPASTAPTDTTKSRESVVIHLNVQGNIIGTQEFVDQQLIPALKDAIDNRDFVIIGNNSRQAANLSG